MNLYTPDPHPGRCHNRRHGKRCLDYDNTPHVCEFPPPDNPVLTVTWSNVTVTPTPWVKPGDNA